MIGRRELVCFFAVWLLSSSVKVTQGLSSKTMYGVKNSGWTSPQWNWGYAAGTGHDCAAICRENYRTIESRMELVQDLCTAPTIDAKDRKPENFEEIKLTLALAWQRGRWDGSDGGRGGYGQVLAAMADASRYEDGSEAECSWRLVEDMQQRFSMLKPEKDRQDQMAKLQDDIGSDYDAARRKCCGLVLEAMGFVENGL